MSAGTTAAIAVQMVRRFVGKIEKSIPEIYHRPRAINSPISAHEPRFQTLTGCKKRERYPELLKSIVIPVLTRCLTFEFRWCVL